MDSMATMSTDLFTLGHSPDPDDAFMFYAMATNKIDLRGYRFEHRLEDIQTLNERALRGELHLSAISINAYAHVADKYASTAGLSIFELDRRKNSLRDCSHSFNHE